jgi:large subunit ribosomal protein L4
MELQVVDKTGKDTGRKVELATSIFGIDVNDHAIYLDVKQFLANQRQGTHKTKDKSEIVGSTRKLKKQKGTGTARAGSIKSGVFRGGGRFFGPKPRNYSFKLNTKLKQVARRSALTYKANAGDITLLEDVKFDAAKTKDLISLEKALNVTDNKSLFVLADNDKNFYLSSRNLKKSQVLTVNELNTYSVLNADKLIFTENAISKLNDLLG